jgi:hypothetical protein
MRPGVLLSQRSPTPVLSVFPGQRRDRPHLGWRYTLHALQRAVGKARYIGMWEELDRTVVHEVSTSTLAPTRIDTLWI